MAGRKRNISNKKATVPISEENKNNPSLSQDDTGFMELFSLLGGLNQEYLTHNPYLSNNILKSISPLPKKYTREEINTLLSNPRSRIVAMSFCEPRSWTRVLSS